MSDKHNDEGVVEAELAGTRPSVVSTEKSYIESLTLSNTTTLVDPDELARRAKRNAPAEKKRISLVVGDMLAHYPGAL